MKKWFLYNKRADFNAIGQKSNKTNMKRGRLMDTFIVIMIILGTIMGGATLYFTICSLRLIHAESDMIRDELKSTRLLEDLL
jgi:hypothetical protein